MNTIMKNLTPKDSLEADPDILSWDHLLTVEDEAAVEDVFAQGRDSGFDAHLCCCTGCGKQFRYGQFECHIRFCPNCGSSVMNYASQSHKKECAIVGGYF